ncbi:F-box protein SKP2A-like isoform X2 [Acropora millepora]|uniref:F-box protein SKP2A-like isoform X2 n=1 Tax=Acropora millepora TaxID=45264 RepID=UPI001CF448D7|nr:F-box protein SKP2A-like isoform X2 [Acropora millepora]
MEECNVRLEQNANIILDELANKELKDDDVEEIIVMENVLTKQLSFEYNFHDLPVELVLKIFSYLNLSALVCKLWLHYSRSPVLRQKLSLSEITIPMNHFDELSAVIVTHFPFLKHLYLQQKTKLTLVACRALARVCPYLQCLSLASCETVTKEELNEFATFCPQLRDINLEACAVTDECLEVLSKLPLQGLNACYCTHLTDRGLKFLATDCRHLRSLNFDGIQWISEEAIAVLVENCKECIELLWLDGEDMTDNLINLETLKLKKGTEFSAQALKELFEHLHPQRTGNARGLVHVNIGECSKLDDAAVEAIANSCRYLESIDISWCWEVTDTGLEHVINKCHWLVDLNICGGKNLHGNLLKEVPKLMQRLRSLDATQCNLISDDLLDELAFLMPTLVIFDYYGEKVFSSKFRGKDSPISDTKNSWLEESGSRLDGENE